MVRSDTSMTWDEEDVESLIQRSELDASSISGEVEDLIESLEEFYVTEDRPEPVFRMSIVSDQMGDISRHISHDPEINPSTRPLDEPPEVAFGDAFYQLMVLAYSMEIDIEEAIRIGRERCEGKEGYLQQDSVELRGNIAAPGIFDEVDEITGVVGEDVFVAYEMDSDASLETFDEHQLVLTEIGGMLSHAANLARESGTAAGVGVKGLTDHVEVGDRIVARAGMGKVVVEVDE